jgi:hypothetical protein
MALAVELEEMTGQDWSDDGVLFNHAGAELATEIIEAQISPLHVGGTKRTSNLIKDE